MMIMMAMMTEAAPLDWVAHPIAIPSSGDPSHDWCMQRRSSDALDNIWK